jgi:EmrB/QacA subfamily drug resistance transporter
VVAASESSPPAADATKPAASAPILHKPLILAICCMSILIVSLDVTILNVALPSIQRDLHASIAGAQWTIDAYTLVLASLLLLAGSTADRLGRRRIFQLGLAVFTLGSLLCSLAPSLGWLIAFRMLQAVGGSMLNPVALSIISNTFTDGKERARAIGAWSGVVGISIASGPIAGGALVDGIGWRSVFWINIPIGLVALVLARRYIPESHALKARRPDPVGQVLIIGFLATLVFAIIEGPAHGWRGPVVIGCFAVSLLSLVGLIRYELKRTEPLLELRFFRSAPFSGASIVAVTAFAALGGFLFLNTLYLQDVRGLSALRAGLFLLPMAGAMFVLGPVSGALVGKRGPRLSLTIGAVALSLAGLLFALWGSHLPDDRLFLGYGLIGVGLGMMNAAITNTAVSGMPRSQSGVASATTSTTRQIGQSLGVAIVGSILASGSSRIVPGSAFTSGAQASWWLIFGCGIAVLIVAITTTGQWGQATAARTAALFGAEEEA